MLILIINRTFAFMNILNSLFKRSSPKTIKVYTTRGEILDLEDIKPWQEQANRSGAKVLEREENTVIAVERQDGTIFKQGDDVLFTSASGHKEGPWKIRFFNIYNPETTEVSHCSAAFEHTTLYVLSIGLLEHC